MRDRNHPREAKWSRAPFSFALDIWKRDRATIGARAADSRIFMDKIWDGRHKSFGVPDEPQLEECPNCCKEAETQGHILLRCSHPAIVRARNAAMTKVVASLSQCYGKDAALGRFLEGYHLLLGATTDDAASMMTGMLTPAALAAVSALKPPKSEGKVIYRQLVKFCKGYRDACTDIYGVRTALLRERMEALLPVVDRQRQRIPRGHWYRPLRRGRPMISRATDYPGLDAFDWRRSPSIGERHGVSKFFHPLATEALPPADSPPGLLRLNRSAARAIERELRPCDAPASSLDSSLGEWRKVPENYRAMLRHSPRGLLFDHGEQDAPMSHMCDKSPTSASLPPAISHHSPVATVLGRRPGRSQRPQKRSGSLPITSPAVGRGDDRPGGEAADTGSGERAADFLLRGHSQGSHIELTLDLRCFSELGGPGGASERNDLTRLIGEARSAASTTGEEKVAAVAELLGRWRSPILTYSRRIDRHHYEDTVPDGTCGWQLVPQLRQRALSTSIGEVCRMDLTNSATRASAIAFHKGVAERVHDGDYAERATRLEAWLAESTSKRRGEHSFLPLATGLWFDATWFFHHRDFNYQLFSDSRGADQTEPPFSSGYAMLWSSNLFGYSREYTFRRLLRLTTADNPGVLSDLHFWMLPQLQSDYLREELMSARADLAHKVLAFLQSHPSPLTPSRVLTTVTPITVEEERGIRFEGRAASAGGNDGDGRSDEVGCQGTICYCAGTHSRGPCIICTYSPTRTKRLRNTEEALEDPQEGEQLGDCGLGARPTRSGGVQQAAGGTLRHPVVSGGRIVRPRVGEG